MAAETTYEFAVIDLRRNDWNGTTVEVTATNSTTARRRAHKLYPADRWRLRPLRLYGAGAIQRPTP
jgi:hypothetical protein